MIIVDMNLSPDWVPVLASHGFASVHWRALGPAPAQDRTIFDRARESGAIILTQDLDFGVIGTRVVAALRTCARELAEGAILTIDDNRHRVRLLPLRVESPET